MVIFNVLGGILVFFRFRGCIGLFLGIVGVLDIFFCVYGGILVTFLFMGVIWSYSSNRGYFGLFQCFGRYFGHCSSFRGGIGHLL